MNIINRESFVSFKVSMMGTLQLVLHFRGSSPLLLLSNLVAMPLASEPYLHKRSWCSSSSWLHRRDAGRDAVTPTCQDVQSASSSSLCFLRRGIGCFRFCGQGQAKGVKLITLVGLFPYWETVKVWAAECSTWPYLRGVLSSFSNKQAYKVRFIASDFLIRNWSPFNL